MYKFVITFLIFICSTITPARGADDTFEWMGSSFDGLSSLFGACLTAPAFASFHTDSKVLNLANAGQWVSTGASVQNGKLIKFDWRVSNVTAKPRKYLVLYRIDPRFNVPQVFIQTYDYTTDRYVSDFHQFKSGKLTRYQNNPTAVFSTRIVDYTDYFNFTGRAKIPIYSGDVVNITLIDSSDFFVTNSDFSTELSNPASEFTVIDTITAFPDNKIIYSNTTAWCSALSSASVTTDICNNTTYLRDNDLNILLGMNRLPFPMLSSSLPTCSTGSNGQNQTQLCLYDKGRGMVIKIGGKIIKDAATSFIHSNTTNKDFLYYKSSNSGSLDITTDWLIDNMLNKFPQLMNSWNIYTNASEITSNLNNNTFDMRASFLHFGRYLMSIEIGNGDNGISVEEQNAIKVEYTISDTAPAAGFAGTEVGKDASVDANRDGYLWVRVINSNSQVTGNITVNYSNYTGTTIFSRIIDGKLIGPLTEKFNDLSRLVYVKLATNSSLILIVRICLSLYIALYAVCFMAGITQITMQDLIIRVIKITFIVILFSPNSWDFFNNRFFQIFTLGIEYLMRQVTDASSTAHGIFGFIDPIFDRYTNPKIWGLLFIQLLQIHNGLAFFAIMTIYSILIFFRGVLEVIIGYCLAYVGLTIMISLAPIFITLMLFERTKSIFDNWVSTLFDYMIQPTILLIFFLFIDQLIGKQLVEVITQACWKCFIPLEIGINLRHIGIPIDFSFELPFLPCIPFYVTDVEEVSSINNIYQAKGTFLQLATSSLLFYCYCVMARGLVEYVSIVTSSLTNVLPARQEGRFQRSPSATGSVMSDMGTVLSPIKSAGKVFKDKVIDQNYRARGGKLDDKPTYIDRVRKNSNPESHQPNSNGRRNE